MLEYTTKQLEYPLSVTVFRYPHMSDTELMDVCDRFPNLVTLDSGAGTIKNIQPLAKLKKLEKLKLERNHIEDISYTHYS